MLFANSNGETPYFASTISRTAVSRQYHQRDNIVAVSGAQWVSPAPWTKHTCIYSRGHSVFRQPHWRNTLMHEAPSSIHACMHGMHPTQVLPRLLAKCVAMGSANPIGETRAIAFQKKRSGQAQPAVLKTQPFQKLFRRCRLACGRDDENLNFFPHPPCPLPFI